MTARPRPSTHRAPLLGIACGATLLLAACLPIGEAPPSPGAPSSTSSGASKTLTLLTFGEPTRFITTIGGAGLDPGNELQHAVTQHLSVIDDRGQPRPQLATELPSQAAGTWTIRADGTMQTTYRIRDGVRWHDGALLTARDFVFAWQFTLDTDLPIGDRNLASQIGAIDMPNELTLVIEWKRTYPFANTVTEDDLGPLPAHILGGVYPAEKERVPTLPYWTREFVGLGPYRVAAWDSGSQLVLQAFDGYFGGRPKIDRIVVRFIASSDAAVATVLAGAADGYTRWLLSFEEQQLISAELRREGAPPLSFTQVTGWNFISVQFRPEIVRPRDLLDARVRRAFLQAIDRQAMSDALFDGRTPVADWFPAPGEALWDQVSDAMVRYPYDLRGAQDLLSQAGWSRAPDGRMRDSSGAPASVALWTTTNEQEIAILADYWKALGVDVEQTLLGGAQTRNIELRASFPSLEKTSNILAFQNTLRRVHSEQCPKAENRWVGSNRGCYQNAANDRVTDALRVAVDPAEQNALYRDLVRLHTEDLPLLPLYFVVELWNFRAGVSGPRATSSQTNILWNVVEWDAPSRAGA